MVFTVQVVLRLKGNINRYVIANTEFLVLCHSADPPFYYDALLSERGNYRMYHAVESAEVIASM